MDWFRDQMKKGLNPRTYGLLGALALVLFWIHSLDVKQRELRAKQPTITAAPALAVPLPSRVAEHGEMRAAATPAGWGIDPFERKFLDGKGGTARSYARPAPAAPQSPGLYLQGIMEGPMGRTALINGEIYREGQHVGSREVIQIGKRAVMLLDHGTVLTLTLKGDG
jgi:hypothetical protein